jgi:hypothetical protein
MARLFGEYKPSPENSTEQWKQRAKPKSTIVIKKSFFFFLMRPLERSQIHSVRPMNHMRRAHTIYLTENSLGRFKIVRNT